MVYIDPIILIKHAYLTHRLTEHRSLPTKHLVAKDIHSRQKMLRVILITMLISGTPAHQIIAPHIGLGTCLFENNTCTSQIICVCDGGWTCHGVPDYHKVHIAGDTITLEIDDQQTLIVFIMFITWGAIECLNFL